MTGVRGKVVIVTGAASGQGAAEAKLFTAEGAHVVVADINDAGRDVAAGLGALFVRHDVSERASWAEVIGSTLDRYGRLDVLVNNAAVYKPAGFLDTDDELWDLHYRVNQRGVFLGMRAAVEAMLRTGGGSIVNIVSIAAMSSYPGQFAYGTSKWALRGLTTLAATELAPLGIRVNGVYPGTGIDADEPGISYAICRLRTARLLSRQRVYGSNDWEAPAPDKRPTALGCYAEFPPWPDVVLRAPIIGLPGGYFDDYA